MIDKKRLEEAKLMAKMLRVETRLPHDFPFDLVDWLVEQAERVQELEKQNKRYEQALEFYADEETYETKFATYTDKIYDPFTLIELDEGKKARQALEDEE